MAFHQGQQQIQTWTRVCSHGGLQLLLMIVLTCEEVRSANRLSGRLNVRAIILRAVTPDHSRLVGSCPVPHSSEGQRTLVMTAGQEQYLPYA